jgi:hypothetical protein
MADRCTRWRTWSSWLGWQDWTHKAGSMLRCVGGFNSCPSHLLVNRPA